MPRGSPRKVSFLHIMYLVHVGAVLVDSCFHPFPLMSVQDAAPKEGILGCLLSYPCTGRVDML